MRSEFLKIKYMSEKINMSKFCKQTHDGFLISSEKYDDEVLVDILSSNYILISGRIYYVKNIVSFLKNILLKIKYNQLSHTELLLYFIQNLNSYEIGKEMFYDDEEFRTYNFMNRIFKKLLIKHECRSNNENYLKFSKNKILLSFAIQNKEEGARFSAGILTNSLTYKKILFFTILGTSYSLDFNIKNIKMLYRYTKNIMKEPQAMVI